MSDVPKSECETLEGEYQQLMGDLFHDLSQPLSTLTCLLEVNLLLSRSLKQLRHDLKVALQQAHTIARLFRDLRELWQAGSAQQDQEVLSLTACLRDALEDLPPTKPANVMFSSACKSGPFSSECLVNFQASRLRQALLHLLEFAVSCAAVGSEIKVAVGEEEDEARVTIEITAAASKSVAAGNTAELAVRKQREMKRRVGLAIAHRILDSGRGSLHVEDTEARLRLEVRLPLVVLAK